MKRLICLLFCLLLFASLTVACSNDSGVNKETDGDEQANEETVVFEATVIKDDDIFLVTPVEGSSELSSSDKIAIHIALSEGEEARDQKFKSGDLVKITYNGLIAESYPAQIWASKVELIGRNLLIDGYKAIINDIYLEDFALNDGIKMIAFDVSDWTGLSNAEKETLFAILNEDHKLDIIEGSTDDLKEMGLINEEGLYFEEGILIEIKDIVYNKEASELSASISKWRSGDGAIGWDVKASYKDGKWEIVRDNNWIS
ncbi:MAG: DUF3221 domain-containing protein [Clostridiales bacterium]|nr:DUF3221 domain-containing protein [Clostridiales bacterium]